MVFTSLSGVVVPAQLMERVQAKAIGASGCVDKHKFCASWAEKGECVKNRSYMLDMCEYSCDAQCGQAAATHKQALAAHAAATTAVETPTVAPMATTTTVETAAQCEDQSAHCAQWAA